MKHETIDRIKAVNKQSGFTLIELMIVVLLVGIISVLALPSYEEYVQRSHRANARSALLLAAQWMERAATVQGTYPICDTTVDATPPACQVPAGLRRVDGGRYLLDIVSVAGGYVLRAVPTALQQQTDGCATFGLNQAGTRLQIPTTKVPTPLTANECWTS